MFLAWPASRTALRLDATQAGLSPLAAVLGERLTPSMIAGGALVLLSTLLASLHEGRAERSSG